MKTRIRTQEGATLVELLLVIAITGIFLRLVTLGAFQSQQRVSLVETRDKLMRDMRRQQYRAMMGVTDINGATFDYSIYFEPTRYTLFPGSVYPPNNPQNIVQPLDPPFRLETITLTSSTLTFARVSGDMRNYASTKSSLILHNTQTGNQILITINPRGVARAQNQ